MRGNWIYPLATFPPSLSIYESSVKHIIVLSNVCSGTLHHLPCKCSQPTADGVSPLGPHPNLITAVILSQNVQVQSSSSLSVSAWRGYAPPRQKCSHLSHILVLLVTLAPNFFQFLLFPQAPVPKLLLTRQVFSTAHSNSLELFPIISANQSLPATFTLLQTSAY